MKLMKLLKEIKKISLTQKKQYFTQFYCRFYCKNISQKKYKFEM